MKKKLEIGMACLLIALVFLCATNLKDIASATGNDKIVVVVDAGHGGVDPGKVGVNNVLEKDINLRVAVLVKEKLEAEGITVIMTRDSDKGLYNEGDSNKKISDMKKRCEIISESECLLTVSIHQNSYHEESVSGPQVFYYSGSKKGEELAGMVQKSLVDVLTPPKIRSAKANDSYYLLKNVTCPVVIVECGFLSNWNEATLLCDAVYQEKVAEAVCRGILEYIG
ncbi:MAG: N-acetylmuramoyl-L-alanine amidase [Lachnospiraceae bacterium]|nr:N-acetylmuramoyl-L-alanine amidase [Lachnospiraceae bacterium]